LDFYIAFNGILTFDKTGKLAEVVKNMPFDRILTETDAPYLTPTPFRGKKNKPAYVKYVAQKVAELRETIAEEAGEQPFQNARALFGVSP
jgi:TatD DNase family protein